MTKKIRVENADTAPNPVIVQTWDKGLDGAADTLVREDHLFNPCAITPESTYITSTRYVVIKEGPPPCEPATA